VIEERKAVLEKEIFRPLGERIAHNFARLVGEDFRVSLDDGLLLDVRARTARDEFEPVTVNPLSYGTREQLSFLLRLAVAESLSENGLKLMVLDDSFVNSDDARFAALMNIIREKAGAIQFLIFSCKETEYGRETGDAVVIDLAGALRRE
jgi:DNA repair exonuclease SbcCD ATPase subunit